MKLLGRARDIYKSEGFVSLLRRGLALALSRLFFYRTYYLYADHLKDPPEGNEADFRPRVGDFNPRAVASNADADELETQGFEFRSQIANAREVLDSGAIALCIFVGRELGNINWIATTQEAKDRLGEPPYKVEFANKEACVGAHWTNPKYRRLGLRMYKRVMTHEVARERGIVVRRSVIRKNNIASITSRMKTRGNVNDPCGEGRHLRILWWESWKERPL